MNVMTSKMQERKMEAAEFLLDTRCLPCELRWEIRGMVKLLEFMNTAKQEEQTQTRT